MKILCVLVPHFPWRCEVLRHPTLAARPALVTYTAGSQKLVLDFSPGLEGLHTDMPLQAALARYGDAELLPADIPHYRAVFNGLLDALEGVSPLVEGAEPGCAYIGVDGLQLIYPDDGAIIAAMRGAIPPAFNPRLGLAANKFLAYLAASQCPAGGQMVLAGHISAFLRDLPCDVLPISPHSRKKLSDFGLRNLGQVAKLSPGPLQAQFGPEGRRIRDLARGQDDTPLHPRLLEEVIEEGTTLDSVTVSLEAILVALEGLLGRVFARIGRAGLGIRSLKIWTRTWNAEPWERTVKFKEPALDIRAVIERVRRVMEGYPQPGPVEQVGLVISRLGFPGGRQNSLFREVRSREHLMEDIRQLELRLGNPQVYRMKEVEPWSRMPERRYVLAPTSR